MIVSEVRELARDWVRENQGGQEGYRGAMLAGSILRLDTAAPFPEGSDVDIWLVLDDARLDGRYKKQESAGLVLEPAAVALSRFKSPETALADYTLACHLARDCVIDDPEGWLGPLARAVAGRCGEARWIRERCAGACAFLAEARRGWGGAEDAAILFQLLLAHVWTLAQLPMLASNRDPTIRRGLAVSADLLRGIGRDDLQLRLTALAGISDQPGGDIGGLAEAAAAAMERAIAAYRTPFPGDNDLSPGSLALLRRSVPDMVGHGEFAAARFWCLLHWGWSMVSIGFDGSPAQKARARAETAERLASLGLADAGAIRERIAAAQRLEADLLAALPRLMPDGA